MTIPQDAYNTIESSGALNGERFASADEVLNYFTVQNFQDMFGPETDVDQADLDRAARYMIAAKLHMTA